MKATVRPLENYRILRDAIDVYCTSARLSLFPDDAIAACGFWSATHLYRLSRRSKGTNKTPIIDPRSTEIGATNDDGR
jgi:hypothetical protein